MNATREGFLAAYRAELVKLHPWAQRDGGMLDRLMQAVRETITTKRTLWVWDAPSSKAAWKAIGGAGKLTLTALRALPVEPAQQGG